MREVRLSPGDASGMSWRRATALLAALAAVVMSALLAAAPAHAATGVVTASCTGNTLNVQLDLQGFRAGSNVNVAVEARTSGWQATGLSTVIAIVSGQTTYTTAFDITAYKTVPALRVTSNAAGGYSATSSHLDPAKCAPPTQIPEAPSPLAIPATLAMTAALAEVLRRRRSRPALA